MLLVSWDIPGCRIGRRGERLARVLICAIFALKIKTSQMLEKTFMHHESMENMNAIVAWMFKVYFHSLFFFFTMANAYFWIFSPRNFHFSSQYWVSRTSDFMVSRIFKHGVRIEHETGTNSQRYQLIALIGQNDLSGIMRKYSRLARQSVTFANCFEQRVDGLGCSLSSLNLLPSQTHTQ